MEAEHCTQGGSMQKFRTLNYTEIESYPKKEWEIVMKGAPCPDGDMRFNRRIPVISELCDLPLAKKAELKNAEVIAIVMYTGPMVCRHCVAPSGSNHFCLIARSALTCECVETVCDLQHHSS
jgi:hypothetical protein